MENGREKMHILYNDKTDLVYLLKIGSGILQFFCLCAIIRIALLGL